VALRQVDDRRLVEPFAGGTSVERLLDDPAEGTIAAGERPMGQPSRRRGE